MLLKYFFFLTNFQENPNTSPFKVAPPDIDLVCASIMLNLVVADLLRYSRIKSYKTRNNILHF